MSISQDRRSKAVLQDTERYENMRNTIGLLKLLAIGEEDIRKGHTLEQAQVFHNIEKLFSSVGCISNAHLPHILKLDAL